MATETDWSQIDDRPSPAMRAALYRLGCSRSLVKKLNAEQADRLIKAMLAARQAIGPTTPKDF